MIRATVRYTAGAVTKVEEIETDDLERVDQARRINIIINPPKGTTRITFKIWEDKR